MWVETHANKKNASESPEWQENECQVNRYQTNAKPHMNITLHQTELLTDKIPDEFALGKSEQKGGVLNS